MESGLKQPRDVIAWQNDRRSLQRERGLKFLYACLQSAALRDAPVWERGLK